MAIDMVDTCRMYWMLSLAHVATRQGNVVLPHNVGHNSKFKYLSVL
jgi:hypothetical protein